MRTLESTHCWHSHPARRERSSAYVASSPIRPSRPSGCAAVAFDLPAVPVGDDMKLSAVHGRRSSKRSGPRLLLGSVPLNRWVPGQRRPHS